MNVLPIGGKSDLSEVKGIAVDNDGNLKAKRLWSSSVTKVIDVSETPADTSTIGSTSVDASECGAVSLRINNGFDVPIQIGFYADWYAHNYQMRDVTGALLRFAVDAGKSYVIVTPDDVPALQWLKNVHIYAIPTETPTSGTLEVWLVTKA